MDRSQKHIVYLVRGIKVKMKKYGNIFFKYFDIRLNTQIKLQLLS